MSQTLCGLYYATRNALRIIDLTVLTHLGYEIFSLFDYLSLCNVFQQFAFCARTCDINDFCFVCSRVYFTASSVNNICRNMFSDVHFKQTAQHSLQLMFL